MGDLKSLFYRKSNPICFPLIHPGFDVAMGNKRPVKVILLYLVVHYDSNINLWVVG